MTKLVVSVIASVFCLSSVGCNSSYDHFENKSRNEALVVELSEEMNRLGFCQNPSTERPLEEILSEVEVCLEYAKEQSRIFENIMTATSDRERRRYKKSSRELTKSAKSALNN